MQKPSETEILEGINAKDREALLQLFAMYYAPLKYLAKQLINKDLRDDIVKDVFIKLRNKNRHFESFKTVRAFLYGAMIKSCLKIVRRKPHEFNLLTEKMIKQNAWKYIVETEYVRLKALELEKA